MGDLIMQELKTYLDSPKDQRYTLAVDFDGVLHSYTSPWVDAATIPDPPVPGAMEWLHRMLQYFDIAIFSTRNHQDGGVAAMKSWLAHHSLGMPCGSAIRGIQDITFPTIKPAALIYLDDRAVRFTGFFRRRTKSIL